MECRMDGRVALITGSSRGLGRAMAMTFAQAGAKVAVVGRRAEVVDATCAEINAVTQGHAVACPADVSTAEGIADLIARTERDVGPIDILVNNAGSSQRKPFVDITDEMWSDDLELKLFGAIRTVRSVFPGMIERKWGRIINVLNTGAKAAPAGGAPTAVSRAAGMALTKVLANEGAPHNVLVNGLLVGKIESDQWRNRWEATDKSVGYDEYLEQMAVDSSLPMGRVGTAQEFANMACFLCSDAGSYINGCAINVDGGLSPVV